MPILSDQICAVEAHGKQQSGSYLTASRDVSGEIHNGQLDSDDQNKASPFDFLKHASEF